MNRRLRVGVVGLRRGLTLARESQVVGMEVVAVCDLDRHRLSVACDALGAVAYQDYDAFLAHDMDGVILANFFDEHAPLAIKALQAGRHVMSETAACKTFAEGVQLLRTVEQTGLVYLFAENYPFKPHVRELRRLYQAGEVGALQYGECEYLHGFSPDYLMQFGEEPLHWRSRVSSLAYCTHSITPVMYVTDTLPTEVSAFVIPSDSSPQSLDAALRGSGIAAVMLMRMDSGAYLKSLHGFLQGEQEPETSWVRIHGSRGLLENLRQGDSRRVRVRQEAWATKSGQVEDTVHDPVRDRSDDALVCESFAHAMQTGEPPYFDVYRGVDSSLVGICGLRSLLHGSVPIAIPDLRQEDVRYAYESDNWNGLEGPPKVA
jgi:predicted dehydrogenase